MKFSWFVTAFLTLALLARAYELGFSKRAIRGQKTKEWITTALHVLYVAVYVLTAAEYFLVDRTISLPVTIVGLLLFIVAMVVRNVAIQTLGKLWSIHLEIRDEHKFIHQGIYSHLRHPAYLAIMIEVIAIPLVANAYWTVAFGIAVYIPVLLIRWTNEERELIKKFGDEYRQYTKQVPAFLPIPWARGSSADSPRAEPHSR